MKIVVFGPERRVGALLDGFVVDLARAAQYRRDVAGTALPSDLRAFIEAGPRATGAAAALLADLRLAGPKAIDGVVFDAASVVLHAPQVYGARVACISGNFADHTYGVDANANATEGQEASALPAYEKMLAEIRERGNYGFWKIARDAAGPEGNLPYPDRTKLLDFESELAIVIGKRGKDIKAGELADYVWGVTLFQDYSVRDGFRRGAQQYKLDKNFDASYGVGPCIVVGENIDINNTPIETYVNGQQRQSFNTKDMIFKYDESLEFLSRDLTFYPGDIISGGTARGTAMDSSEVIDGVFAPELFLHVGDVIEARSPAIGVLRNHIVAK
jgi:acylpyruvate hydrolase